jgi:hypothetical protein
VAVVGTYIEICDCHPGGGGGGGGAVNVLIAGPGIGIVEGPPGTFTISISGLTQDMILPAYTVSLTLVPAALQDLGLMLFSPAFTAAYNRPPAAAVLTDSDGNAPTNVIATPTSFSSPFAFIRNVFGQSVTFTLTANEAGGPSKTATQTMTWANRVFFGQAVTPGAYNEAFIEGLPNNPLTLVKGRTFTVTAGATQRVYYALRSAFGTPTFTVGGFTGGFHLAASAVPVTNAFGITENYDVWESDNVGLGTIQVVVT